MLCGSCHGKGFVWKDGSTQPCGECGGSGILHCCEGLVAQPEDGADTCSAPSRMEPPDRGAPAKKKSD